MSKILLLIPTAFERKQIEPSLLQQWQYRGHRIELCGFGLAVSGTRAMYCINETSPCRVALLGVAGSLSPQLCVGHVATFERVRCDGIGVGSGSSHQSASELGWMQWNDTEANRSINDQLSLVVSQNRSMVRMGTLLSVAAASIDSSEAQRRQTKYPDASAEDMEGFAVACACRFANVPLTIIRGISNMAGNRNHSQWNIAPVLNQAMKYLLEEVAVL